MAQTINTNVASLNSQRSLNSSQSMLNTALQRLSSGLRINSAKDDAAGMAISSRMTAQINGLNQAGRNANDGISLAQTAEGALQSVTDSLQRMRTLAVQASNATNSATDRAALQKEVDQLVQQINTVASQTSFNGVKLLDGSFNSQAFQVGANAGEMISIDSIKSAKADALGVGTTSTYNTSNSATVAKGGISAGGITVNGYGIGPSMKDGVSIDVANSVTGVAATGFTAIAAGDLKINGVSVGAVTAGTDAPTQGASVASAINAKSAETGVSASADGAGLVTLTAADGRDIKIEFAGASATTVSTGLTAATTTGAGAMNSAIAKAAAFNSVSGQTGVSAVATATTVSGGTIASGAIAGDTTNYIKINGVKLGAIAAGGSAVAQGSNVAAAINAVSNQTGVTATFSTTDGKLSLTAADGRNVNIVLGNAGAGTNSGLTAVAGTSFGGIKLSSTSKDGITLGGADIANTGLSSGNTAATATFGAGLSSVNLSTASGAQNALATIDSALAQVNSSRADLGALQNRFSSVVANLATTSENVTAARSRIQDADFAEETAALSKAQILQQAGVAMLSQANALPQNVLSLLR